MPARPASDATCGGLVELSSQDLILFDAPLQIALDGVLQLDNVMAGIGLAKCQQGTEHIGCFGWGVGSMGTLTLP